MTVVARTLRLGTRGSALALAQAETVRSAIGARTGHPVDLIEVNTEGDRSRRALTEFAGTGVFVTALRERLLAGTIDVVVHSLKDLPTRSPDGLVLAAVPVRENPLDALVDRVGRRLAELPPGSRIGTGSPRRAAALRSRLPGVEIVPVRGNVDTRLAMVHDGRLDAVVLAVAGLTRLGRAGEISDVITPEWMLPAPGQGALAVECRADDPGLLAVLDELDDPPSRVAVAAERALLARLEAGCAAPLGALATVHGDQLSLDAAVLRPDGEVAIRLSTTGRSQDADAVGSRLADRLLAAGAARLIGEVR